MKRFRKGVFVVVFIKKPLRYLLLHRKWHWRGWEFPKGGLLAREKLENAVKREIKEETGLRIIKVIPFKYKGKFIYDKNTQRERKMKGFEWTLFAVEVKGKKVKISRKEHDNYKWANYSQAMKLLRWPDQRTCLSKVNKAIKKI